jgi:tetratricopeptide (TPR) repeat protein
LDNKSRSFGQGERDVELRRGQQLQPMPSMTSRARWSIVAVTICMPATAAAALARGPGDVQALDWMRTRSPQAAELLERGETLGAAGKLEDALALFRAAEGQYPNCSLLERRECEALTALGQRSEAVRVCYSAFADGRFPVNASALARAMVAGPAAPTSLDVSAALSLLNAQRQTAPRSAAVPELACAIARSLGDTTMLQHCIEDLERMGGTDDREAQQARSLLQARCPPARFWVGWLTIAAVILLTLADAARRLARGIRPRAATIAGAALVVLVGLFPRPAVAADSAAEEVPRGGWLSKWPIDNEHPEKSVPTDEQRNAEPLEFGYWLQDLALKGEHAVKKGDHQAAIKLFTAMAAAVPEASVSYSKLCDEYEAIGDREKAKNLCGVALSHDGVTVKDYSHFVHLVLATPGPLTVKEKAALSNVIGQMKAPGQDPDGLPAADELECEVGARTSNVAQLRECTAGLAAHAPNAPDTITYQWALAVEEGKFVEARDLIAHAKFLGLRVDHMEKTTREREKRSWLRLALRAGGILVLLGACALAARALLHRRRRVAARAGQPSLGQEVAVHEST